MADGFLYGRTPGMGIGAGLRTELGTITQPGGEVVAYVRSGGPVTGDHPDIRKKIRTTLNAALALCRSGRGDVVCVLPGHTESISSADQMSNLVAGTRILGLGHGTMRPTFTWTAATATFLFDVADTSIENCILNLDPGTGTTTVAAPITISAAGCAIRDCQIRVSTSANSKTTVGITTTAADAVIANNYVYGAATAVADNTTAFRFTGADRLRFVGNYVACNSAAGTGPVQFVTTASLNVNMVSNVIMNTTTSSTVAVTGMSGVSGYVNHMHLHVLSDNVAALTGAFVVTGTLLSFGRQCYVTNNTAERAALFGTESA